MLTVVERFAGAAGRRLTYNGSGGGAASRGKLLKPFWKRRWGKSLGALRAARLVGRRRVLGG